MEDWRCLAIETATERASVAVVANGQTLTRVMSESRNSSREIYAVIQALLAEAGLNLSDLRCVACSQGPGSFTGVRVAVAAAQGLGYSLGVPVIGVSTLATLARSAMRRGVTGCIAPCLDARMGEAYVGLYDCRAGQLPMALLADRLVEPAAYRLAPQSQPLVAVGPGWEAHPLMLQAGAELTPFGGSLLPTAAAVLDLAAAAYRAGQESRAQALRPNYLRDKVAFITKS